MQEMEKKLFEERKEKFKKTLIGKVYYNTVNLFQNISGKLRRDSNQNTNEEATR